MRRIPLVAATSGLLISGAAAQATTFGPQQVITTAADSAFSVYAADLDGDGDMDVLSASEYDAKIACYLNDGLGGFSALLSDVAGHGMAVDDFGCHGCFGGCWPPDARPALARRVCTRRPLPFHSRQRKHPPG